MFETKPPNPAQAQSTATPHDVADELRALSWGDLAEKLAAARDLRTALAKDSNSHEASFDALSAQHLAEMHEIETKDNHEAVNPDDLGNRKGAGGINDVQEQQRRPATRGNT